MSVRSEMEAGGDMPFTPVDLSAMEMVKVQKWLYQAYCHGGNNWQSCTFRSDFLAWWQENINKISNDLFAKGVEDGNP